MTDATDILHADLVNDEPSPVAAAVAAEAVASAPEVVEVVEVVVPAVTEPEMSDYRPVGGADIRDYLNAKGAGLQGRPSKATVQAFLLAKGA